MGEKKDHPGIPGRLPDVENCRQVPVPLLCSPRTREEAPVLFWEQHVSSGESPRKCRMNRKKGSRAEVGDRTSRRCSTESTDPELVGARLCGAVWAGDQRRTRLRSPGRPSVRWAAWSGDQRRAHRATGAEREGEQGWAGVWVLWVSGRRLANFFESLAVCALLYAFQTTSVVAHCGAL